MIEKATGGLIEHFSAIQDPRADNSRHILVEIITIAVCAAIWNVEAKFPSGLR